jgi:hypothetical protein
LLAGSNWERQLPVSVFSIACEEASPELFSLERWMVVAQFGLRKKQKKIHRGALNFIQSKDPRPNLFLTPATENWH